jgi:hypothetical protein
MKLMSVHFNRTFDDKLGCCKSCATYAHTGANKQTCECAVICSNSSKMTLFLTKVVTVGES